MSEVKFSKEHEWIKLEGDIATIGITKHATEMLGDIVFAELPEKGSNVDKDGTAGVVESTKAASDVYTPVSGEVVDLNQSIVDEPDGKIDTQEERDEIWSNVLALGRPVNYHHNFDVRYTLPISKIPLLSWVNTSVNYDANYDWRASSQALLEQNLQNAELHIMLETFLP